MIYAIANQKGGVGKTTTAATLAVGLAEKGYKVLAIDSDPQGNLSDAFGADNDTVTLYEVLKGEALIADAVQRLDGIDLISADITLASAEQEFTKIGRERILAGKMKPVREAYDYIIIDAPPSLGMLTINAFAAADSIIVPTTAGLFATKGLTALAKTVSDVRMYCGNENLKIDGILLTKFDARSNNNRDFLAILDDLAVTLDTKIYKSKIRNTIAVEEAQARAASVLHHKSNNAAADYRDFIDELIGDRKGV